MTASRAWGVAIAALAGVLATVGPSPVQAQACFCLQGEDDDLLFDCIEKRRLAGSGTFCRMGQSGESSLVLDLDKFTRVDTGTPPCTPCRWLERIDPGNKVRTKEGDAVTDEDHPAPDEEAPLAPPGSAGRGAGGTLSSTTRDEGDGPATGALQEAAPQSSTMQPPEEPASSPRATGKGDSTP